MCLAVRHTIFSALILLVINLPAQNLTGTWEGALGTDQFLQLNILQTGNKICGYTRDHVIKDTNSFCKAFFEGSIDSWEKMLTIDGKYFIEKTKGHFLMNLNLYYKIKDGIEILEDSPEEGAQNDPFSNFIDTIASRVFSFFNKQKRNPFTEVDSSAYVYLKKVANQPYEINELMKDCIGKDRKKTGPILKKDSPKPDDSLPLVAQIITPGKTKDSLQPSAIYAPFDKDSISNTIKNSQRKNIEQSHLAVNVKTIHLKVYDNAIMDGDTVSILYNGKVLLTHQLLSEKGIELSIDLDETQSRHEITLYAENLGSIPPNTALVIVTAGTKRYELFASASLEENAVLVFDYKPDK